MDKHTVEVWLELETRCNLRCGFCYNFWKDGVSPTPKKISTELMLQALDNLFAAVECKKMAISGGEPLLREDLYEIIERINSHAIPMVLTTNGLLLNESKTLELMKRGIVTFQIPLHSTRQKIHDELSGLPCWKDTLHTILMLKECGANVIPVYVATGLNLSDFTNVVEVCFELGLREIIFNRFIPGGLGLRNHLTLGVPTDGELLQELVTANAVAGRTGVRIHLGVPIDISPQDQVTLNNVTISSCPVGLGQTAWVVDCEGNLRRCNHSGDAFRNLLTDGATKLREELGIDKDEGRVAQVIKGCHYLGGTRLVKITGRKM